ncbi:glycosyltransferase family 2 protein [Psychrobacillus sp. FSL K6-2836]
MQKTNFHYEILIGEDCSTDNTREIIEEYARLYPEKIRIITSEKNVGPRQNSHRLLNHSKGKYIAECEGDDYWTDPYKLQQQVEYMESHPNCSLCFHAAEIIKAPKKSTGKQIRPYKENQVSPIEDIISGGGGFCPTGSLLYPKKFMETPPDFYWKAHVGDYPMQLILSSKGYTYYIDKGMAVYRIGVKGSWSSRLNEDKNFKEKMIEVYMGDISVLTAFNTYTNLRYSMQIEKKIMKLEFEILLLKKDISELKSSKFKAYINEMGFKKRIEIYVKCHLPILYIILARMKINK